MTPAPDNDDHLDDRFFDSPLTLQDYIEIVTDDLNEAVDALNDLEIEPLCRAIRKKLYLILDERRSSAEPAPEAEPAPDRWWDR